MKYCQKCGGTVSEGAVKCDHCGCMVTDEDKANITLMILSFLIPIAGIILWPVKHKKAPKAARTYGLIGIISWAVVFVLNMIIMGM